MNYEAFGVTNVCQVREKLHGVDELFSCFQAAFYAETHDAAEPVFKVFGCDFVVRVVGQAGIVDPIDELMTFQESRNFQGVFRVFPLSERKCFQALKEQESIEWT